MLVSLLMCAALLLSGMNYRREMGLRCLYSKDIFEPPHPHPNAWTVIVVTASQLCAAAWMSSLCFAR